MSGRLTSQAMITRTIVVGYTNIDIFPGLSASNTSLKNIFASESRVVWTHAPKSQEIQYNVRKAIAHGMEMSGGFMHPNYPPLTPQSEIWGGLSVAYLQRRGLFILNKRTSRLYGQIFRRKPASDG